MKGFSPVHLSWKGEKFTVPADRQLQLILEIEDALAGASGQQAIAVLMQRGGPSYARLSQAYGAALRYAGADVSDDEIYLSIMSDMAEGKADAAAKTQTAILALLAIIAPPVALQLTGGDANPTKPDPEEA